MALHTGRGESAGLNILSLCTGGAGLDLGVELAIPSARSVCLVEREAFAVARLVEAMQEGLVAPAPIWSDARTFNGRPWRGLVDGLIGGIPCQPHSLAGQRLGEDDERDLWGTARRIIVQARPWFVLIENVAGMLSSGGAERVYRDLHRLGYKVEGGLFRASEVGAPQERERLFILGVADPAYDYWRSRECGAADAGGASRSMVHASGDGWREGWAEYVLWGGWPAVTGADCAMGDADGAREDAHAPAGPSRGTARQSGGSLGDTLGGGRDGRPDEPERGSQGRAAAEFAGEGAEWEYLPAFPPGPSDRAGWEYVLGIAPDLEPAICGVADGLVGRVDQLRMLGNGVVPLQAAYALRTIATRAAARGSAGAAILVRLMEMAA